MRAGGLTAPASVPIVEPRSAERPRSSEGGGALRQTANEAAGSARTSAREEAAPMEGVPRFSVLIPTYRDASLVRRSLPVLLASAPGPVEVVILNNYPQQDVSAAIGDHTGDARVRIVEMGFEAGFARAINRGIRETSGEFVMFCNADLFPTPEYVSEILAFFERRPQAGAAIGKILRYELAGDRPTNLIDTAGLALNRQRRFMPRGEGERDDGRFDEELEVFGVDGAAMVVRRSALDTIRFEDEYLDENFYAHKEDHDVSWRLRLAGWECWYVPSALAYHARTTRGLGSTGYLSAVKTFHRNELEKSTFVQVNAMKNQWLMLLKNEDLSNLARDFLFILGRELMVLAHRLFFSPRSLAAVPMTLRITRETLRKRRAVKGSQRMSPGAVRSWLGDEGRAGAGPPS
jgi:GT2 family glycosyltransferase